MHYEKRRLALFALFFLPTLSYTAEKDVGCAHAVRATKAQFAQFVRAPWPSGEETMPLMGLQALFEDAQTWTPLSDDELLAIGSGLGHCATLKSGARVFHNDQALIFFGIIRERLKAWKAEAEGLGFHGEALPKLFEMFAKFAGTVTVTDGGDDFDIGIFLDTLRTHARTAGDEEKQQISRIEFIFTHMQGTFGTDTQANLRYNIGLLNRLFTDAEKEAPWATKVIHYMADFLPPTLDTPTRDEIYTLVFAYMSQAVKKEPHFNFDQSPLSAALAEINTGDAASDAQVLPTLKKHLADVDDDYVTV